MDASRSERWVLVGGIGLSSLLLLACTVPIVPVPEPSEATDLYEWTAPPAVQQLELDDTRVSPGWAAIFVPAISNPDDEPEVVVLAGDDEVASGSPGQRIQVPPGDFTVRVGSGSLSQSIPIHVRLNAGETRLIGVQWGGLIVEVVDENNRPFRGDYELIRMEDREVIGVGFGADTLLGERLRTWILAPGLYRIVQPGSTYRARTDFASVFVPEDGLVRFKLVLDSNTGEFRGAGVVWPGEMSTPMGNQPWTQRMVLGITAGLAQTDAVVGVANQLTLSADLFLDTLIAYEFRSHSFTGILELEEGIVHVDPAEGDPLPLQHSRDRLRVDLVYTYFLNEWVGPYLGAGAIASIFPAEIIATEDFTVRRLDTDGNFEDEQVDATEAFNTSGAFGSVQLRQGVGINLRVLRTTSADINFRVGAGFRQNLFHDAYVEEDDPDTAVREYRELENFNQEGIESVLTGRMRFLRFLTYTTEAEFFGGFDAFLEPTVSWLNTLSFRFTSYAALDYTIDLRSQPQVTEDLQLRQNVLLRLSWDIL